MNTQNANEFFLKGCSYKKQGNYDAAIASFDEAIKLDPTYAEAYKERGIVFSYKEKVWAILDFNKALELNPTDAEIYFLRAQFRPRVDSQGHFLKATAIDDFTKAIELGFSPLYLPYFYRGQQKVSFNKLDAIADFNQSIQLNPCFVDAYLCRAKCYEKVNLGKAIKDYTFALKLIPKINKARRFLIMEERTVLRIKRRRIVDIVNLIIDLPWIWSWIWDIYKTLTR